MRKRTVVVAGLITAAAGIAIQYVSGVEMPVVPPGLVLLLVAAALVAIVDRRWTLVVGVLAAVAELAGLIASGAADALVDATPIGTAVGAWVRLLGVVVAVVAAAPAIRGSRRSPVPGSLRR